MLLNQYELFEIYIIFTTMIPCYFQRLIIPALAGAVHIIVISVNGQGSESLARILIKLE